MMRLELGTFPVRELVFGPVTRYHDGVLEVDRDGLLEEIRADDRLVGAELEIVRPGDSVRIWPVRDAIEPRIKVEGPGTVYPGMVGRPVATVGSGRTHRLSGMTVLEVSNVLWHSGGGDFLDLFIDMTGPWADVVPQAKLLNLCLAAEPDRELDIDEQNIAVHTAALLISDTLAQTVADLEPPQTETFELTPADGLPRVYYVQFIHSPQGKSQSLKTFHTSIYGISQLCPPWLLHPNEILDGAISGPYRTAFATTWSVANNPLLLELYRRHGTDIDFRGVLAFKTEWTMQHEKNLMAAQAAKMLAQLGTDGVIMSWDASGNEYLEVVNTLRECERLGIKVTLMTTEEAPTGGVPTLLEPTAEADAIVSTGYRYSVLQGIGKVPPVDRVIGEAVRTVWRDPGGTVIRGQEQDMHGELDAPWRYDDHYGFNALSVVAY
jgi:glycine reductase complex component B subunit alpha and beta